MEHTDFSTIYGRLVEATCDEIRKGSFSPEAVPRILQGLKDEIMDLCAGFKGEDGKRVPLPKPLLPMKDAKQLLSQLNDERS